jgi:hypothetical protein
MFLKIPFLVMNKSIFKFRNKINVHKGYAYKIFNFSCLQKKSYMNKI